MKTHWKERYSKGGVCDFKQNYDFYFKWLLNKTASCFYITGLPDTVDETYLKSNLLLDGNVCITKFDDKLYACIGSQGGPPDEYYCGTVYTIANPVLGSKMVKIGTDGVVVYNTKLDKFTGDCWISGLYELINQTATLLADNIISISCCQINTRIQAMVTADSEAQALGGEIALKKMYAGQPYQVLRSDLIDKIHVNPINNASNAQNISELVELHNYIIANYFQSIGIKANDIRKKSHVLQDEIDVQNDYLQISIYEILACWQAGFDKVNKLYGTDIHVELNPALLDTLLDTTEDEIIESEAESDDQDNTDETDDNTTDLITDEDTEVIEDNSDTEDQNSVVDEIIESNEQIEDIIDVINDEQTVETTDTELDNSTEGGEQIE